MQLESLSRLSEAAVPVGGDALAHGLLLMRASTLKMIRLQLAMERQDRRGALEAVDDLVALDRRLQDTLADVPAAGEQLLFRNALDAERAVLNREKMTLAAQVIRRMPEPLVEAAPADDWLGPAELSVEEEPPRRRRRWPALAIPLLLAAAGGMAYVAFPQEAQAWIDAAAALRR